MAIYIYIGKYVMDNPQYLMYDPEVINYSNEVAPYEVCSVFNDCEYLNLPPSKDQIWIIKDNPFVYYASTYSWLIFIIVVLISVRPYYHRKGWQEVKDDIRSVKEFFTLSK
jgi:hypothetical protein